MVPQQPPARLSQPSRANSPMTRAMWSGVSSYSPNSLGRPALGKHITRVPQTRASSATCGRMSSAPSAQLMLTASRSWWLTES